MKKKLKKKSFVKRQIAVASIAVGIFAAFAIYLACTFWRCPKYPDQFQFAILFFIIGAALTYLKMSAFFSAFKK